MALPVVGTEEEAATTARGSLNGMLLFIRYAFMPNLLRYCGGDDNTTLFQHAIAGETDGGVPPLLRKFTGAYPYLALIARENGITDPFDYRVVEAYWIGNALLERVEVRQLYDSLRARFGKQLQGKTLDLVLGKAPAGARPHHSFHVFDVHSRAGQLEHSLETMDSCRVSWGQVTSISGPVFVVDRQPLRLVDGKLTLGAPQPMQVTRQVSDRGFADRARVGDWLSIHWGWACDVLSVSQMRALERYSRHHLTLANQTL